MANSLIVNKSGTNGVATATVDISDILNSVGLSAAEKKAQALRRIQNYFNESINAYFVDDSTLDAQVAAVTADAAAKKAIRPTGNL